MNKLDKISEVFELAAKELYPYKIEITESCEDAYEDNTSGLWIVVNCSGNVKFFNDAKVLYAYLSDINNILNIRSITRV